MRQVRRYCCSFRGCQSSCARPLAGLQNAALFLFLSVSGFALIEPSPYEMMFCVVLPLFHVNGQFVGVMPTLTVGEHTLTAKARDFAGNLNNTPSAAFVVSLLRLWLPADGCNGTV